MLITFKKKQSNSSINFKYCIISIIVCRSSIAIAGDDFVMLASDTRLTQGYNILSRQQTKCFKLTSETMLSSTGCWADVLTLTKILEARLTVSIF